MKATFNLLLLFSFFCLADVQAKNWFPESYAQYLKGSKGIEVQSMKGFFSPVEYDALWISNWELTDVSKRWLPSHGEMMAFEAESKDGECKVYFSSEKSLELPCGSACKTAAYEIGSNLSDGDADDYPTFDLNDYMDVRARQGGDTVIVYNLPNVEVIRFVTNDGRFALDGRYRHASGIIVTRGTQLLRLKVVFTEKGYSSKDKYLDRIIKSIQ